MSVNPVTVLIADDDTLVREAYKAVLEQRGHVVLVAEDGARAIALVESGHVDVVLLDILMPRKEGLETLIELKRQFPRLTIFAMSGGTVRNKTDFLSIAMKFGADGILRKPFEPQVLIDLIEGRQTDARRTQGG